VAALKLVAGGGGGGGDSIGGIRRRLVTSWLRDWRWLVSNQTGT